MKKMIQKKTILKILNTITLNFVCGIAVFVGFMSVLAGYWPEAPHDVSVGGWLGEVFNLNDSGTNKLIIESDKVAIGKTNPAVALDVNGKIRTSSTQNSDHQTTVVTKDYLQTNYFTQDEVNEAIATAIEGIEGGSVVSWNAVCYAECSGEPQCQTGYNMEWNSGTSGSSWHDQTSCVNKSVTLDEHSYVVNWERVGTNEAEIILYANGVKADSVQCGRYEVEHEGQVYYAPDPGRCYVCCK